MPTQNCEVAHAHGTLTVHDDGRFVRGLVARLTRHHEAAEPEPWKLGDFAPEFIDSMLRNIVGIEIGRQRAVEADHVQPLPRRLHPAAPADDGRAAPGARTFPDGAGAAAGLRPRAGRTRDDPCRGGAVPLDRLDLTLSHTMAATALLPPQARAGGTRASLPGIGRLARAAGLTLSA